MPQTTKPALQKPHADGEGPIISGHGLEAKRSSFGKWLILTVFVLVFGVLGSILIFASHADANQVTCNSSHSCSFTHSGVIRDGNMVALGDFNSSTWHTITCQQQGGTASYIGLTNKWWGWTSVNSNTSGWVSAASGTGGGSGGMFQGVPNCNNAHGAAPLAGQTNCVSLAYGKKCTTGTTCDSGYWASASKNYCLPVTCTQLPQNSGKKCSDSEKTVVTCATGYQQANNNTCAKKAATTPVTCTTPVANGHKCSDGTIKCSDPAKYEVNATKTACVVKPPACTNLIHGKLCNGKAQCTDSNYRNDGDHCTRCDLAHGYCKAGEVHCYGPAWVVNASKTGCSEQTSKPIANGRKYTNGKLACNAGYSDLITAGQCRQIVCSHTLVHGSTCNNHTVNCDPGWTLTPDHKACQPMNDNGVTIVVYTGSNDGCGNNATHLSADHHYHVGTKYYGKSSVCRCDGSGKFIAYNHSIPSNSHNAGCPVASNGRTGTGGSGTSGGGGSGSSSDGTCNSSDSFADGCHDPSGYNCGSHGQYHLNGHSGCGCVGGYSGTYCTTPPAGTIVTARFCEANGLSYSNGHCVIHGTLISSPGGGNQRKPVTPSGPTQSFCSANGMGYHNGACVHYCTTVAAVGSGFANKRQINNAPCMYNGSYYSLNAIVN